MLIEIPEKSTESRPAIEILVVTSWLPSGSPSATDVNLTIQSLLKPLSVDLLLSFDLVMILAPLDDENLIHPWLGTVKLALKRGARVVFGIPGTLTPLDYKFLTSLHPALQPDTLGELSQVADDPAAHPALSEFLTIHGQTKTAIRGFPEEASVLGHVRTRAGETFVAAVELTIDQGRLMIIPFHLTSNDSWVIVKMARAIRAYVEEDSLPSPPLFDSELVPGEKEQADAVEQLEGNLVSANSRLASTRAHRALIGFATGDRFVQLAIDELNFVASANSPRASRIEEEFREDFRFTSESGEVIAIAEAKGVNRGVSLNDVNQVNSHRTETFEKSVEELPGILIVNQFRLSEKIEDRQTAVSPRIAKQAKHMNVLVVRTWDLFELVRQKLSDGHEVNWAEMLAAGGGWLTVSNGNLAILDGS